jgi:hypothetical protein
VQDSSPYRSPRQACVSTGWSGDQVGDRLTLERGPVPQTVEASLGVRRQRSEPMNTTYEIATIRDELLTTFARSQPVCLLRQPLRQGRPTAELEVATTRAWRTGLGPQARERSLRCREGVPGERRAVTGRTGTAQENRQGSTGIRRCVESAPGPAAGTAGASWRRPCGRQAASTTGAGGWKHEKCCVPSVLRCQKMMVVACTAHWPGVTTPGTLSSR